MKAHNEGIHEENVKRYRNLKQLEPKLRQKWKYAMNEYNKKSQLYVTKQSTNQNISKQISIKKLLKIADFYKLKVLPIMHQKEQRKLSMIQNIAIPSQFKVKHIRDFYSNSQNELFRFPLPSPININNLPFNTIPSPSSQQQQQNDSNSSFHNRSHSSVINYKSSQYSIALKSEQNKKNKKKPKFIKSKSNRESSTRNKYNKNKNSSSPLQKYMPNLLTDSISSVSKQMGIPFLTPPGYKRQNQYQWPSQDGSGSIINEKESKSLPKNLDDLILPPTFFSDDEDGNGNGNGDGNKNKKRKNKDGLSLRKSLRDGGDEHSSSGSKSKQSVDGMKYNMKHDRNKIENEPNKIMGRNRSQSLDALPNKSMKTLSKRLIHGLFYLLILILFILVFFLTALLLDARFYFTFFAKFVMVLLWCCDVI